jgi:hypothetical protein
MHCQKATTQAEALMDEEHDNDPVVARNMKIK